VKKPISKFAFQTQPAALHCGYPPHTPPRLVGAVPGSSPGTDAAAAAAGAGAGAGSGAEQAVVPTFHTTDRPAPADLGLAPRLGPSDPAGLAAMAMEGTGDLDVVGLVRVKSSFTHSLTKAPAFNPTLEALKLISWFSKLLLSNATCNCYNVDHAVTKNGHNEKFDNAMNISINVNTRGLAPAEGPKRSAKVGLCTSNQVDP
jgi:hypothetical protein